MTLARYFVFEMDKSWLVTFEGRVMARHPVRTDAVESAIGMANLMGAMHYDADVMLQEPDSALRAVWTYGVDPLPHTSKRLAKRRFRSRTRGPEQLPRNRSLVVGPAVAPEALAQAR